MAGSVIGLPPVLNFGSPEIKAKVIPDVLSGQKLICLAISEAFAGSDVAGLKTTAKKTEDGKHWIINGTKKWITNGTYVFHISLLSRQFLILYMQICTLVCGSKTHISFQLLKCYSFTVGCRTDVSLCLALCVSKQINEIDFRMVSLSFSSREGRVSRQSPSRLVM